MFNVADDLDKGLSSCLGELCTLVLYFDAALMPSGSFYGITVMQTYIYFKRNEADPGYMKALVRPLECMQ